MQELVNNSLKHADANQINITLSQTEVNLYLTVQDNGKGFDLQEVIANPASGIGIRNIESRLSVIDGKVEFDVKKGKGSAIKIEVNF